MNETWSDSLLDSSDIVSRVTPASAWGEYWPHLLPPVTEDTCNNVKRVIEMNDKGDFIHEQ